MIPAVLSWLPVFQREIPPAAYTSNPKTEVAGFFRILVINRCAVQNYNSDHNCYFQWCKKLLTASVVYWSEFLATDPEARVRFPALPGKKK
jgi:hypothetical protein